MVRYMDLEIVHIRCMDVVDIIMRIFVKISHSQCL